MLISTVCTRRVVTAHADDSILSIARKMRCEHVGAVVIVGGPSGSRLPVGIVTDRDIVVGGLVEESVDVANLVASDLMSPTPVVIWESDTLGKAIDKIADHGVRRLPVVDSHGGLIGIVSYEDLVGRLAHHLTTVVYHSLIQHRREAERRP